MWLYVLNCFQQFVVNQENFESKSQNNYFLQYTLVYKIFSSWLLHYINKSGIMVGKEKHTLTLTPSSPSKKSSRACLSSALDRSFICWIWCLAVAKTDSTFSQFYFYIKAQWLSIFFHWNTQVSKYDLKYHQICHLLRWPFFTCEFELREARTAEFFGGEEFPHSLHRHGVIHNIQWLSLNVQSAIKKILIM